MVDEVKNRWQAICFRSNLTHRKRSPLPKGEGHLASLENEETHRQTAIYNFYLIFTVWVSLPDSL